MQVATISPMRATSDKELGLLVKELQRQSTERKDYVVPASSIKAVVDDGMVKLAMQMDGPSVAPTLYEPTKVAHGNLQYRLGINKTYYERMGDEATDLLCTNINYWTERDSRNLLVRTLDNKVRAVLSDRFRRLDSVELFFTAFDEAKNVGAKIVQADMTETNFYLRLLHPEWATKLDGFKMDMKARRESRMLTGHQPYSILEHLDDDDGGTWLVPGIVVRNSDVGYGSLNAELFVFDLVCSNGLIANRTIHQVHLGQQMEVGYVSHETRELEDKALWARVRDLIRASFDKDQFLELVKKIQGAAEQPLDNAVVAVETVVKNYGFTDQDKENILNELMNAGSNTVYGLMSAVTAVGRDKGDYDEGVKFERAGGDILNDPKDFTLVQRYRKTARVTA